jgi:hypothetical protein
MGSAGATTCNGPLQRFAAESHPVTSPTAQVGERSHTACDTELIPSRSRRALARRGVCARNDWTRAGHAASSYARDDEGARRCGNFACCRRPPEFSYSRPRFVALGVTVQIIRCQAPEDNEALVAEGART